jgi:hypothetical protein
MSQKGSFDDNNIFRSDQPMSQYCPEKDGESSYYRFCSGMWMLHDCYGNIDSEMIMEEFAPSHVARDRTGKKYPPDPETGAPTVSGTWCHHTGERTEEYPMGTGGNVETSVFNLSRLEVRWIPIMPCHYRRWNLDWHYIHLSPFRDLRRMQWGY